MRSETCGNKREDEMKGLVTLCRVRKQILGTWLNFLQKDQIRDVEWIKGVQGIA